MPSEDGRTALGGAAGPSGVKPEESMLEKFKRLLGYGEACQNGGLKLTNGRCECLGDN